MAHQNTFDTTGVCFSQGQKAEDIFASVAKQKGFNVSPANKREELSEHFDFWVVSPQGKKLKVEVKSQRAFPVVNNGKLVRDFVLVEFQGVTGHKGWLYGKSDLIAFEYGDGFYLVPRSTVVQVAEKLCNGNFVDRKEHMLYNRYNRKGREDEVSAILLNDLIVTRNFSFWKK